MNNQLKLLRKIKSHQQERVESDINKSNQKISELANTISELSNELENIEKMKVTFISNFYHELKLRPKFNSNALIELEIEVGKFNADYQQIQENRSLALEELEQAKMINEELKIKLKGLIIKLEKYNYIYSGLAV